MQIGLATPSFEPPHLQSTSRVMFRNDSLLLRKRSAVEWLVVHAWEEIDYLTDGRKPFKNQGILMVADLVRAT